MELQVLRAPRPPPLPPRAALALAAVNKACYYKFAHMQQFSLLASLHDTMCLRNQPSCAMTCHSPVQLSFTTVGLQVFVHPAHPLFLLVLRRRWLLAVNKACQ